MTRRGRLRCAARSFIGGLKKGVRGERMVSHDRITAAPSFSERRWMLY